MLFETKLGGIGYNWISLIVQRGYDRLKLVVEEGCIWILVLHEGLLCEPLANLEFPRGAAGDTYRRRRVRQG